MNTSEQNRPLHCLRKGDRGSISKTCKNPKLIQRLLALGIRRGAEIEVLHSRSGGVVIQNGSNRVALGVDIARQLIVCPFTDMDPATSPTDDS